MVRRFSFGLRSLVVSSSVRDPRCSVFGLLVLFLLRWFCLLALRACVALRCFALLCVALSALPCVRFVCSGRDELIVRCPGLWARSQLLVCVVGRASARAGLRGLFIDQQMVFLPASPRRCRIRLRCGSRGSGGARNECWLGACPASCFLFCDESHVGLASLLSA